MSRRIGSETLFMELGERAVMCMGAEYRWGRLYCKYLILNAKPWCRNFWREWITLLIRNHWGEKRIHVPELNRGGA